MGILGMAKSEAFSRFIILTVRCIDILTLEEIRLKKSGSTIVDHRTSCLTLGALGRI